MANMPWLGTNEDQILCMTPPAETRTQIMLKIKWVKSGLSNSLHANWFCVAHETVRIKWECLVQ
jgi:hypothetical protein